MTIAISVLVCVPTIQADWNSFCRGIHVDYARNSCWPHPFKETSVSQTREHFVLSANNGWRAHNCLGTELFRDGDQMLTYPGKERLRRILLTNPTDRRVIFVYRGRTNHDTENRVAVVRRAIGEMELGGTMPDILVTDIPPPSSSGHWMTQIERKRLENLPIPALPAQQGESSSGGSE
jgi:hypothetical protein